MIDQCKVNSCSPTTHENTGQYVNGVGRPGAILTPIPELESESFVVSFGGVGIGVGIVVIGIGVGVGIVVIGIGVGTGIR